MAATGGTLTIYGATGYTGRLCAAEALRRGVPLRIAGRREDALRQLAGELGGAVDVAVADVTDRDSLLALAGSSDVLLTTVGPYERLGRPVLEAALAAGCHYVDISGEVPFLLWAHEQDDRAAQAGLSLCPGSGLDGISGDLLAGIAASRLQGPPDEARIAYRVRRSRPSAGTVRSALGMAAAGGAAWVDGRVVAEPVGADHWRAPLPGGARTALSVPLPEVVTVGRSTGARTVRVYGAPPGAGVLRALAAPGSTLARAVAGTRAWDLLERAVDRLPAGPPPPRRGRSRVEVVAVVRGRAGSAGAGAHMADLYQVAARAAVGMAARMLDGRIRRRGVLTPTQALGQQAGAFLEEIGASWERSPAAR